MTSIMKHFILYQHQKLTSQKVRRCQIYGMALKKIFNKKTMGQNSFQRTSANNIQRKYVQKVHFIITSVKLENRLLVRFILGIKCLKHVLFKTFADIFTIYLQKVIKNMMKKICFQKKGIKTLKLGLEKGHFEDIQFLNILSTLRNLQYLNIMLPAIDLSTNIDNMKRFLSRIMKRKIWTLKEIKLTY